MGGARSSEDFFKGRARLSSRSSAALAAAEPDLARSATVSACTLLAGLLAGSRVDGRGLADARPVRLRVSRGPARASAEAWAAGGSRAAAEAVASLGPPRPDRPLEGVLSFYAETAPSASRAADAAGRPPGGGASGGGGAELARVLERAVRDSRAVDVEALCVLPGAAVWCVRVDVRVLEGGGNALDAGALAAVAALLHLRRPDAEVTDGGAIRVFSPGERAPLALPFLHVPLCVTFGALAPAAFAPLAAAVAGGTYPHAGATAPDDALVLLDASAGEEEAGATAVTFVVNAARELCGLHKAGGAPLAPAAIVAAAGRAADHAAELTRALRAALEAADADEREAAAALRAAAAAGRPPPQLPQPAPAPAARGRGAGGAGGAGGGRGGAATGAGGEGGADEDAAAVGAVGLPSVLA